MEAVPGARAKHHTRLRLSRRQSCVPWVSLPVVAPIDWAFWGSCPPGTSLASSRAHLPSKAGNAACLDSQRCTLISGEDQRRGPENGRREDLHGQEAGAEEEEAAEACQAEGEREAAEAPGVEGGAKPQAEETGFCWAAEEAQGRRGVSAQGKGKLMGISFILLKRFFTLGLVSSKWCPWAPGHLPTPGARQGFFRKWARPGRAFAK